MLAYAGKNATCQGKIPLKPFGYPIKQRKKYVM